MPERGAASTRCGVGMTGMERPPAPPRTAAIVADAVAHALWWGVYFAFVESLAAFGAPERYPDAFSPELWVGLLLAALTYSLILFIPSIVLSLVLLKLGRRLAAAGAWLIPAILAIGLWILLARYWEAPAPFVTVLIGGATLGLATLLAAVRPRFQQHAWTPPALARAAAVSGILAAAALGQRIPTEGHFMRIVYGGAYCWLALVLVALLVTARKSGWASVVVLVIGIAVPGGVLVGNILPLAAQEEAVGPNLLFITCDAMRADKCSLYDGPVSTPALERLASRGAVLERCYALAPWTVPSVYSLLQAREVPGLTPGDSIKDKKADTLSYVFDPDYPTLAQLLQERGYSTAAFVANPLLRPVPRGGFVRGFESTSLLNTHDLYQCPFGQFGPLPVLTAAALSWTPQLCTPYPRDFTGVLTRQARNFIRRHRNGSFFVWIHYMDPHDPFDPPAIYRTRTGPWPYFTLVKSDAILRRWDIPSIDDTSRIPLTTDEMDYAESLYDGSVRYVDARIGQLLDEIESSELTGQSYVCVSSDHGEEFREHGRFYHGQSLYDELMRVPLVVAGPGIKQARHSEPVSAMHLMRTFAGLLDFEAPAEWHGEDLAPALEGQEAIAELPCYSHATNFKSPEPQQMIVRGEYKLIRGLETGEIMLFDLRKDPAELLDVHQEHPELAADLLGLLEDWSVSFPHTFDEAQMGGQHVPQGQMRELMESLGYL